MTRKDYGDSTVILAEVLGMAHCAIEIQHPDYETFCLAYNEACDKIFTLIDTMTEERK